MISTFIFQDVEGTYLDYKVALEKGKPKSWLKSVSAFANSHGGHILFGVTNDTYEAINDPFLIPNYAVLDSELTVGLPPYTTATTGMDALTRAVEAYTNHTYNTKLENRLAKEAVKLIYDNILIAFEDGKNLEARQNMQRGAFYAGRAFTRGCVGYVHAVGHTLGGLYSVALGLALAVLLPHDMREFGAAAHKRLAELADVCGIPGRNDAEKANAFIAWIEETNKKMGLPDGFDVIKDDDIPQMIA